MKERSVEEEKSIFDLISTETATRGKKVFLEISLAQVFSCEFCEISKKTFFYRIPLVAASISKSNIKTSNEKKKPRKKIAVLKEDKQVFAVIVVKAIDLHEAFPYPITSLSLSITSPNSSLYQSDKACFRNYIMKSSNSVSSSFLQIAKRDTDGIAAMHSRSTHMS